ncbi:hypothetical protein [Rhodococcus koreensis]|uniref:Uncharacterized protein n=1 Tax=Rhodococcus koreensis TaxID=99653 RepID=A0A1H4I4N3_9NOCA|nr:hypothetical protein [Rhodococcus koreensis]SEB29044.1 hypothetical protein SAMN04490239_0006 [Rhodococcus koreensis]SEB30031.1 hypothetical protein SAMN04490239_0181 [Rhodococcus koreensis]
MTTRKRIDRKRLDQLAEIGARRRELRAELAKVEADIDPLLKGVYLEGWSWDQIADASGLSLQTVSNRLRKQGVINGERDDSGPFDQFTKADLRTERAQKIASERRKK